jgi:hypothetical protein
MRVSCQHHALTALHLRKEPHVSIHWTGSYLGPGDSLDRVVSRNLSALAGNEIPALWSSQQPCHCPEYVNTLVSDASGPDV